MMKYDSIYRHGVEYVDYSIYYNSISNYIRAEIMKFNPDTYMDNDYQWEHVTWRSYMLQFETMREILIKRYLIMVDRRTL